RLCLHAALPISYSIYSWEMCYSAVTHTHTHTRTHTHTACRCSEKQSTVPRTREHGTGHYTHPAEVDTHTHTHTGRTWENAGEQSFCQFTHTQTHMNTHP